MGRLKFQKIPGLIGTAHENPLLISIDVNQSSPTALNYIRENLKATNKSVGYQIKQCVDQIEAWKQFKTTNPKKSAMMLSMYTKRLGELREDLTTEYFSETDQGMEVPIGFWYLFDILSPELYMNREISPVLLPELRDYQSHGVTELLKYKRSTVVMATGLGKSLLIKSVCASAVASGKRVCVVVPTEYLVKQVVDCVKPAVSLTCGVSSKRKMIPGSMVMVATVGSSMNCVNIADVIIFDECHHMSAKTWVDVCLAAKAEYMYNLTATPFRSDGLDLGIHAFGGPVVFERDTKWGIENGWLAKPRFYCINYLFKDSFGVPIQLHDKTHKARAYNDLVCRKEFLLYLKQRVVGAINEGHKCIVLFKTVRAGLMFKKVCDGELNFNVASGDFKKPIEDFGQGLCPVLVSNDRLLSEGVDIPNASVLFNVLQNKSDVTTYQAMGRVLRKKEPNECIIVDIALNAYRSFEKSAHDRHDVYETLGQIIKKTI
jgi:superfamily II DNA or RNA helicase